MDFVSNRLVLGRSPQEASVVELAEDESWQRVEAGDDEGARRVVWSIAPGCALTYIEDPVSHNAYVVLGSEDRETYDRVLDLVEYELMPFTRRALLISIDEARDPLARARAVIQLGLGAPEEYDEEFFEAIRKAFGSEEKWVREAAVWSTAYSPWPQYRPLLEAMAHNDPEENLRTDATTILAGFTVHGL